MPKVFISHSSDDRDFVEAKLLPLLKSIGIQSWYSTTDIQTAELWESSIKVALASCDWFLVVMGPSSARSEWVKDEVHWAMDNRQGHVLPVLIGDCDPLALHIRLPRIQHVDFRAESPAAVAGILRALKDHQEFSQASAAPPAWKPKVVRIGIACGLLSSKDGRIEFSELFLTRLCQESQVLATEKLDCFLKNGWSELMFAAGVKAKDVSVKVTIDEFEELLIHGLALPLTKYLADLAEDARLLLPIGKDGSLLAADDMEDELWSMSLGLKTPEEVKPFIVRAYIELANARLLVYKPAKLDHCHLLALFLFLVFKDVHVAALEYVVSPKVKETLI